MRNCDVTEGWAVVDGGVRIFRLWPSRKIVISQFLLGFTVANAHQSKGILMTHPTGSSKIASNKIVPEIQGNKDRGSKISLN